MSIQAFSKLQKQTTNLNIAGLAPEHRALAAYVVALDAEFSDVIAYLTDNDERTALPELEARIQMYFRGQVAFAEQIIALQKARGPLTGDLAELRRETLKMRRLLDHSAKKFAH